MFVRDTRNDIIEGTLSKRVTFSFENVVITIQPVTFLVQGVGGAIASLVVDSQGKVICYR